MIIKLYYAVKYEMILGFKEAFQYKTQCICDLIIFTAAYILLYTFHSTGNFMVYYGINRASAIFMLLIGFIFWQFNSLCFALNVSIVQDELMKGTLELKIQSNFPLYLLLFFRIMVKIVFRLGTLIGVVLFTIIVSGFTMSEIPDFLITLLVMIPSLLGMSGIGLFIGGISIKVKNVGQFTIIVQTLLLFMSNAASPTTFRVSYLLPFTYGIDISRSLFMHQADPPSIVLYLVLNCVWMIAGILFFSKCVDTERKVGSFDTY